MGYREDLEAAQSLRDALLRRIGVLRDEQARLSGERERLLARYRSARVRHALRRLLAILIGRRA